MSQLSTPATFTLVSACLFIFLATTLAPLQSGARYFHSAPDHHRRHHHGARPGKIRVASGYPAREGEYPSFVTLKMGDDDFSAYSCGGVIVGPQEILTAAHCPDADGGQSEIHVKTGITGVHRWNINDKSPDIYRASRVCLSGQWSENGMNRSNFLIYDFAILRLDRPIEFSKQVQPVRLPARPIKDTEQAFVVGSGSVDDEGNMPEVAKVLPVKLAQCHAVDIHESTVCFRANDPRYKGDSCSGDSGGPVYATIDGQQYLYGLTSFGVDVCRDGTINTGIYSDVQKQVNHVRELIDKCRKEDEAADPADAADATDEADEADEADATDEADEECPDDGSDEALPATGDD